MNKNILNSVPIEKQKTNVFDLSHDIKLSFNMGKLIPTTIVDTVPGDSFTIGFENLLRFSALLAPIMHRVKVTTHYFFVPNRILWDNWEKWITGELDVEPPYIVPTDGNPSNPYSNGYWNEKGSLLDYMGVPVTDFTVGVAVTKPWTINALPIAAYWKIYHEYYMDQNNDPDFENFGPMFTLSDGDNSANQPAGSSYYTGLSAQSALAGRTADRAWMHDYFTSALPWAQKGDDVFIPLTAPVISPFTDGVALPRNPLTVKLSSNDALQASVDVVTNSSSYLAVGSSSVWIDGQVAENTDGDGTINNLRRAFALQSWLEKNARGGTRYTESILVHFGVRSSDARLQRPEYLGGSVQNMVISEVLSTAQTLDSTDQVVNPVGQMSGHGISVGGSNVLKYYCEEHGWIIGLISVMPMTAYQDGIPKKYLKTDRFEYFWPSFQHIGEQEIKTLELAADPRASQGDLYATFGYVPRYTEYKYENNRVAGDFRDTLDFWHLGRKFRINENSNTLPLLNEQFIYPSRYSETAEEAPFDRIFAVAPDVADSIYCHILNKIKARRPMAMYGIPSI